MPQQIIDVQDAKQSVEKPVKQKLSIQELTTIISPGKPTPRQLEKPEKPKRKRTRKTPTSDFAKDITPKEYTLIITEKPQAAQKIAQALSDTTPKQVKEGKVSYYELSHNAQKIVVANAVGHLFNLNYKAGQKGYPIFELEWTPSYDKKSAAFTKPYFNLLKKLSKRASNFIIASVDYNEQTPVIENGKFKLIEIGDLVEGIKSGKKQISNYLIPSFNEQGIIKWNKLKNAISHKINEELYEISLEYGRKVKLTSSHNIFKLKNNKITLAKTTDLKAGESILCPSFLPSPKTPNKNISTLRTTGFFSPLILQSILSMLLFGFLTILALVQPLSMFEHELHFDLYYRL